MTKKISPKHKITIKIVTLPKPLNFGEEVFSQQLKALKISFEREFKFHPKRKWKFDFAFPDRFIAVEIEGGVYSQGRHNRPTGFINDMEKYNNAAILGWRVFRYTPQQIKSGKPINIISDLLGVK